MMEERGIEVDHSTIRLWAIRFLPLLEMVFRKQKRSMGRVSVWTRQIIEDKEIAVDVCQLKQLNSIVK